MSEHMSFSSDMVGSIDQSIDNLLKMQQKAMDRYLNHNDIKALEFCLKCEDRIISERRLLFRH